MTRYLILSVMFLFSNLAFANFSGSWGGQGEMTVNGRDTHDCSNISISIDHTSNRLDIHGGVIRCGSEQSEISGFSAKIDDRGTLRVWGKKIGSVSSHKIVVDVRHRGKDIYLNAYKSGDSMSFQYSVDNGQTLKEVEGDLYR